MLARAFSRSLLVLLLAMSAPLSGLAAEPPPEPVAPLVAPEPAAPEVVAPSTEPTTTTTAAPTAPAETLVVATEAEPTDGRPIYERGGLAGIGLTVAAKFGGGFSQAFSELGAAFVPELELGITLPFAERMLEVFVSGQWAAPTTDGTAGPDPRLPGDQLMTYEVTQQQVALTLGLRLRIPIPSELFRPHFALGARLYLMRTEVSGEGGGEAFGDNEETATEAGFFAAVGGELFVGPGALLLEVQLGYASLDGFVMRDTNVGALNVMLGYRLFL